MFECDATTIQLAQAHSARDCRRRLMTPPNAIPDRPLSLKKPVTGVNGLEAIKLAQEATARAKDAARIAELERQIEELILRLAKNITVDNLSWLAPEGPRSDKYPPSFLRHIKQIVARHFDVTISDIDSVHRAKTLVIPRHVAIYLVKELLPQKSYPEIGRKFGGRDHSTAINAARKTPIRMRSDAWLCQTVIELQTRLEYDLERWRRGA